MTMRKILFLFYYTDYLPVYFQACLEASALRSGVDLLPYNIVTSPFTIIGGITVTKLKMYRPQNFVSWVTIVIGMGLFSTLQADSATRNWVGFQIIPSIGLGVLVRASLTSFRRFRFTFLSVLSVHCDYISYPCFGLTKR